MATVGLITIDIPKDSIFDKSHYEDFSTGGVVRDSLLPFILFDHFIERKGSDSDWNSTGIPEGEDIRVSEDNFFWLSNIPIDTWKNLPLQSHQFAAHSDDRSKLLVRAINYLRWSYPEGYAILRKFVRVIAWLELREEFKKRDTLITSVSIPMLPFCSFISDRALRHIPPNIVIEGDLVEFLAENLYHEAIHQAVNMNILLHEIFRESYDSRISPKVEIPWRSNQSSRNQRWELDRVLHAAIVYANLLEYRLTQIESDQMESSKKDLFAQGLLTGYKSASFLTKSMFDHEHLFTSLGFGVVESLSQHLNSVRRRVNWLDNQ